MVTDSSDSRLIEYRIYTPSDAEAMTRILSEVFCRRDPPAMAVGLTTAEFEDFVRLLWPQVAADGLTIVAELAGTGELVGAMLTADSAAAVPDGMDKLSAKFNPIFDILGGLDAEYRGGREFRPGRRCICFCWVCRTASLGGEWGGGWSRLASSTGSAKGIGWPSRKRPIRLRNTSFANWDLSSG